MFKHRRAQDTAVTQTILYIHRTVHRERQWRQETAIWFTGKVEFHSLMGQSKKKSVCHSAGKWTDRAKEKRVGFTKGNREKMGGVHILHPMS